MNQTLIHMLTRLVNKDAKKYVKAFATTAISGLLLVMFTYLYKHEIPYTELQSLLTPSFVICILLLTGIFFAKLLHSKKSETIPVSKQSREKRQCPLAPNTFTIISPCTFAVRRPPSQYFPRYQFANTPELTRLSAILNIKIFFNTIWRTSLQSKLDRNIAHAQRNPNSILIVYESCTDKNTPNIRLEPRGFSHILPVTEYTWHLYRNGKIADNEFTGNFICQPGNPNAEEEPYGLILFSVGALKKHDFCKMNTVDDRYVSFSFLQEMTKAMAFHLVEICKSTFPGRTNIPLIIQTERPLFKKWFEEYNMTTQIESKDGCPFFIAYVNPMDDIE